MAYLQHTSWKDRPGAVAGVIAIHAAIGYVLINGLSFVAEIVEDKGLEGYEVEVPLDPPPPSPTPTVDNAQADIVPERPPVAPLPPVDLTDHTPLETTHIILPPLPKIPPIVPSATPGVDVGPAFDPVAARPSNDPARWVTTEDYRTSWINREWTGTARFRLEIAASGKVTGCKITESSGHAALDQATCDLVTRRARFDPALNADGAKTPGSYTSAVRWELPR